MLPTPANGHLAARRGRCGRPRPPRRGCRGAHRGWPRPGPPAAAPETSRRPAPRAGPRRPRQSPWPSPSTTSTAGCVLLGSHRPGVAADLLAGHGQAHGADLQARAGVAASAPTRATMTVPSPAGRRVDVARARPGDRSPRARPRRPGGREAVAPGTAVTSAIPAPGPAPAPRADGRGRRARGQAARLRRACLSRLVADLGDDDGDPALLVSSKPSRRGQGQRSAGAPRRPGWPRRSRDERPGGSRRSLPPRDGDAGALAGRRVDLELVDEPLRAAQAQAQPVAGRVAVGEGQRRCRGCPAPGPRR